MTQNLIFITAKELNGVKKSILNDKEYNLLAIIDLNNDTEIIINLSQNSKVHLTSKFMSQKMKEIPSLKKKKKD